MKANTMTDEQFQDIRDAQERQDREIALMHTVLARIEGALQRTLSGGVGNKVEIKMPPSLDLRRPAGDPMEAVRVTDAVSTIRIPTGLQSTITARANGPRDTVSRAIEAATRRRMWEEAGVTQRNSLTTYDQVFEMTGLHRTEAPIARADYAWIDDLGEQNRAAERRAELQRETTDHVGYAADPAPTDASGDAQ